MLNLQQRPQPSTARRTYRDPSDIDIAEYPVRSDLNHLHEDPDIEENIVYRVTPGSQVTNAQLNTCSKHFSEYYGVWSKSASAARGAWAKEGQNIQMGPRTLKAQILPDGANNILITAVTEAGRQIAHCFVSEWTHRSDRIWWITQLVVLPSYRDQRRATKMLRALVLHYDIGKLSDLRDFVGVLTSHPYTLSAVLRVFGRGIESLPPKSDWVKCPTDYPNAPLSSRRSASFLKSSPVNYVHDAALCSKTLSALTNSFVDHTVPDLALQRIIFAMNKQMREPWQWLFGDLAEGHEYLCVLNFRYNPEYKVQPQLYARPQTSLSEVLLAQNVTSSPVTPERHSQSSLLSQSPIDYAEINRYLLHFPATCRLNPMPRHRTHFSMTDRTTSKMVLQAKDILSKRDVNVSQTMSAKRLPDGLRLGKDPLPNHISTWRDLNDDAEEFFDDDPSLPVRLLILQAIHFKELKDECERLRKDAAERKRKEEEKKRSVNEAKKRTEDEKRTKKEEYKPIAKQRWTVRRPGATNGLTRPQTAEPMRRRATPAPESSTVSADPEVRTERTSMSRYKMPRSAIPKAIAPGATPNESRGRTKIESARPLNGQSPSPQLFFPSDSSRGSSRSNNPSKHFPRNSCNALNRGRWSANT